MQRAQEELSLKAQAEGDLTEEEERAMIERAKNLSHEVSAPWQLTTHSIPFISNAWSLVGYMVPPITRSHSFTSIIAHTHLLASLMHTQSQPSLEYTHSLAHSLASLAQAAELRTEKLRVQAEADAAEAQFHRVRFAAGVYVSGITASSASSSSCTSSSSSLPGGSTLLAPAPGGAGASQANLAAAAQPPSTLCSVGGAVPPLPGAAGTARGAGGVAAEASVADLEVDEILPAADAAPIIARFALLEEEVQHVEETLVDYSGRLGVLQGQLAALRSLSQPKARDAGDESEVDLGVQDALTARAEAAQREAEHTRTEAEEARALKLAVEQSVSALSDRLSILPAPEPRVAQRDPSPTGGAGGGGGSDSEGEGEGDTTARFASIKKEARRLLARDFDSVSSPWAASLHCKLAAAAARLEQLVRDLDEATAKRHYAHAVAWLREVTRAGSYDTPDGNDAPRGTGKPIPSPHARTRANSIALTLFGGGAGAPTASTPKQQPQQPAEDGASSGWSSAAVSDSSVPSWMTANAVTTSSLLGAPDDPEHRALQATIEALVTRNGCAVRVRPGSGSRSAKSVSGKAISEAVHAFERSWKEGPGREETEADATPTLATRSSMTRMKRECAVPLKFMRKCISIFY